MLRFLFFLTAGREGRHGGGPGASSEGDHSPQHAAERTNQTAGERYGRASGPEFGAGEWSGMQDYLEK